MFSMRDGEMFRHNICIMSHTQEDMVVGVYFYKNYAIYVVILEQTIYSNLRYLSREPNVSPHLQSYRVLVV